MQSLWWETTETSDDCPHQHKNSTTGNDGHIFVHIDHTLHSAVHAMAATIRSHTTTSKVDWINCNRSIASSDCYVVTESLLHSGRISFRYQQWPVATNNQWRFREGCSTQRQMRSGWKFGTWLYFLTNSAWQKIKHVHFSYHTVHTQ